MDDYLRQHIQEKKNVTFEDFLEKIKIPHNAMIPQNMSQVNLNQLRNPMNIPKILPPSMQHVQNVTKENLNLKQIPPNMSSMSSFPRFIPPAMNPMMLQQQQMLMKNPMLMQWMRPQFMHNMLRMNMMGKNFNQQQMNMMNMSNMMNLQNQRQSQIQPPSNFIIYVFR